jgi:hypothetical protein
VPTFHATELRITRLDDEGRPVGPTVVPTADTIHFDLTNPTKEHTAMPTEPRPTKAQVAELREQLARRERQLHDLQREHDAAGLTLRELLAIDREAKALAGCTAAIEAMLTAEREASRNQSNYGYATAMPAYQQPRPEALDSPIGRILLHLAARYGVAIEATLPPERDLSGQRLVSVPR